MLSHEEKFRFDLSKIVRRGSRSIEFEEPIKEVVAHYLDLFDEAKLLGATNEEADISARQRLGRLSRIAVQILATPKREAVGKRLQLCSLITIGLITSFYLVLACSVQPNPYSWILDRTVNLVLPSIALCGLAFGYGTILARRVSWFGIFAVWLTIALVNSVALVKFLDPESLMGMSRQEASVLFSKLKMLEPDFREDESAIATALNPSMLTDVAFIQAVQKVQTRLASTPTRLISDNGGKGYPVPTKLVWNKDREAPYTLMFGHVKSLREARQAWQPSTQVAQVTRIAMRHRKDNLESYNSLINDPHPHWSFILQSGLRSSLLVLLLFGLFTLAGLLCIRLWVMRGDGLWLRKT